MVSRFPYKKKKNKQSYKHHRIAVCSLFCRPGPCNDGMPNSSSALCVLSNRQQTGKVREVMKMGRCDLKEERNGKSRLRLSQTPCEICVEVGSLTTPVARKVAPRLMYRVVIARGTGLRNIGFSRPGRVSFRYKLRKNGVV